MSGNGLNQTFIKVGNTNLYCEYILNGKPPILLIHGFVSSTYTFRRIIPLLQKQFSIIAVDLPGFGKIASATPGYQSPGIINMERGRSCCSCESGAAISS